MVKGKRSSNCRQSQDIVLAIWAGYQNFMIQRVFLYLG